MTEKLTGGEALVAALRAHGTDTVFGIPGTHNLPVYAALSRHGVRNVTPRHEQGAGYAADGWARASGRPGVCLTTTGPALLNAATAAAQAHSDSVPVLFLSPGLPLRHPGRGNGHLHEVKDQRAALDAVVAYSHRVTRVEEIPAAVACAFAAMATGRPRPVHLEIPLDLLDEQAPVTIAEPVPVPALAPALPQVRAAVRVLADAARPVVVAGGGASGAAGTLRTLAEHLGAPVVTTANGKGVLADDHPLAVGAGLHHRAVHDLVRDADAVLAVGTELAPSDLWSGPLDLPGTLIRVDADAAGVTANALPDIALVADAALALRALLEHMPAPGDAAPGARRATRARAEHREQARAEGSAHLGLTRALAGALGRDGVLAGDSTMACYYGALSNLPAYKPRSFLYPTGLGTLGYGLPAAIGAKLARPEAPVVALHGDGGLMFTVQELATAAQLRLPLPVVVVDNGGYGEIRDEMDARGEPVHAVDLPFVDFPLVARAMGCHGLRADDEPQLARALQAALAADRPTLIHLPESAAG
ncbi:5-guanidino-2-oxopentanoate decarboxylase (plasmid) [Streptomyces sp. HUAS 31]|uniref:5-guanidino-2-oxopentanoate decarboxylase n=1 Tax=Streptomyces sp. HUAS 31 TaxID=3020055 RepID=UPI00230506F3|nr:5-guanidino-2-oxopentanoate decarboxylase [Streptomyces sp. HUAS 31]WCE02411.1 5-guanidino-2-oxopentanoate decarboxylase [Streptomyces sp. HUAS 31]